MEVEDVSLTEMCYNHLTATFTPLLVEDVSLTEMCYNSLWLLQM